MAAGFPVYSFPRSGSDQSHFQRTFSISAWLSRLSLLFAVLLLSACATQKYSANPAFMKAAQKPKQVVLLPPDIEVMEISAGGVPEKVDAWSKQAKSNIRQSLSKVSGGRDIKFTELPELSTAEKETVDKYLAFYDVVGGDAFIFGRNPDPAWQHKKDNFDYTLGDGLHFLKQKTGADAALFVVGSDHISSGGRKAAMVIGALMGIVIPAGTTFVSAGLVDLDTGNILWLNYDFGGGNWDIRNPADTDKLVANIFTDYPAAK